MKRFALYLGLATALVASCSIQEEDFKTSVQDDEIFYASFEQPTEEGTRVYANEDLLLRWTADDRVSIFNKITYNQEYRFTGQTGANAGGFKKVDNDEFVTGNAISHVVSVYPYQESTTISESEEIYLMLPAEQTYAENTFGLGANTMVSVSEDNVLQYKNVGGYLMLNLYGEGVSVSSITLKGNNGEKLAGKASVTMPLDGVPSAAMASDAGAEITLICAAPVQLGATADNSTQFWFVVPPTTFSRGFTITVTDARGKHVEQTTTKSIVMERNKLAKMAPLEIDAVNPITIVFADPVVKSICVENWDTDCDGELSYEEAVAVTDIGGVFANNDQIASFNELQFFTGLRSIGGFSAGNHLGFERCQNLTAVTLPASIEIIGECAFERSGLTSIEFPEGVTIWNNAFSYTDIASLVIPEVTIELKTSEHSKPFVGCRSLSSVSFNGPISIYTSDGSSLDSEDPFFQNCEELKTLTFGDAFSYNCLTPLGYMLGTSGMDATAAGVHYESITVSPQNLEYDSRNNCNAIIETATNTLLLGCKNTVIPESVTAIGPWALSGVEASSIIIPESVGRIGDGAIGSSTLSSVTVLAMTPPTMGRNGLGGAAYDFPIYVPASRVNAYKAAVGWSEYADRIRAMAPLPEAVDLGLSVKWASFNLGASKPEEYGDYYAWGETEPKDNYNWSTYRLCMGSSSALTKYCPNSFNGYNGFTDTKTVLDSEDDAASVNLGGKWRMPTNSEWTELRENCTWEWTTINGVSGRKFTSRKEGHTDKWIFLPAAGYRNDVYLYDAGSAGSYWSSSLNIYGAYTATYTWLNSGNVGSNNDYRDHGLSVRPVCD